MFTTTNLSYAIGPGAAWMPNSKWCVSLISAALVGGLGWTCVRGLSLGKWLHNVGAFAMLIVYAALIFLPLVGLARGELKTYHPLQLALPTMSIFYCFNILSKLAVGALDFFDQRSCNRQLAVTHGRGMGPIVAKVVLASAATIQNPGQFDHLRRRNDTSHRDREPDRHWNSGSVPTCRQRGERFLRHRVLHDVRDTNLWRGGDPFRRSDLVAHRGDLRCRRLIIGDFFHGLSDYRRSKPVEFCGENHRCNRDRERDWRRDLSLGDKASRRLAAIVGNPTQIIRQAAGDRNKDYFRHVVRMERPQLLLKRRLSMFA